MSMMMQRGAVNVDGERLRFGDNLGLHHDLARFAFAAALWDGANELYAVHRLANAVPNLRARFSPRPRGVSFAKTMD